MSLERIASSLERIEKILEKLDSNSQVVVEKSSQTWVENGREIHYQFGNEKSKYAIGEYARHMMERE